MLGGNFCGEVRGVSSGVVSRSQTAAAKYLILSNGVRSIQVFAISSLVEFGFCVRDEVFKSPSLLFSRWFVQHRYRLLEMGDSFPAFLAPAEERGRVLDFKERGRLRGTGGVGT